MLGEGYLTLPCPMAALFIACSHCPYQFLLLGVCLLFMVSVLGAGDLLLRKEAALISLLVAGCLYMGVSPLGIF